MEQEMISFGSLSETLTVSPHKGSLTLSDIALDDLVRWQNACT